MQMYERVLVAWSGRTINKGTTSFNGGRLEKKADIGQRLAIYQEKKENKTRVNNYRISWSTKKYKLHERSPL